MIDYRVWNGHCNNSKHHRVNENPRIIFIAPQRFPKTPWTLEHNSPMASYYSWNRLNLHANAQLLGRVILRNPTQFTGQFEFLHQIRLLPFEQSVASAIPELLQEIMLRAEPPVPSFLFGIDFDSPFFDFGILVA